MYTYFLQCIIYYIELHPKEAQTLYTAINFSAQGQFQGQTRHLLFDS